MLNISVYIVLKSTACLDTVQKNYMCNANLSSTLSHLSPSVIIIFRRVWFRDLRLFYCGWFLLIVSTRMEYVGKTHSIVTREHVKWWNYCLPSLHSAVCKWQEGDVSFTQMKWRWVLCIHKEENAVGSWAGDGGFKKEISFVSVRYFVQSVNILKYHFTNA